MMVGRRKESAKPKCGGDAGPKATASRLKPLRQVVSFARGNQFVVALSFTTLGAIWFLSRGQSPGRTLADTGQGSTVPLNVLVQSAQDGLASDRSRLRSLTTCLEGRGLADPTRTLALKRHPFIPDCESAHLKVKPQTQPAQAGDPESERAEAMMKIADHLQVQTVLLGAQGRSAMVSGRLVREGQSIEGWTVKKILPKSIVIVWKDRERTLTLP